MVRDGRGRILRLPSQQSEPPSRSPNFLFLLSLSGWVFCLVLHSPTSHQLYLILSITLEERPELKEAEPQIKKGNLNLERSRKRLRPSLDLVAG